MSNVKSVSISGEVSFCWLTEISAEDGAFMARVLLGRGGLSLSYTGAERYVGNEHGGKTAMLGIRIEGTEAIPGGAIDRIVRILRTVGSVSGAESRDLENGGARQDHMRALA